MAVTAGRKGGADQLMAKITIRRIVHAMRTPVGSSVSTGVVAAFLCPFCFRTIKKVNVGNKGDRNMHAFKIKQKPKFLVSQMNSPSRVVDQC